VAKGNMIIFFKFATYIKES